MVCARWHLLTTVLVFSLGAASSCNDAGEQNPQQSQRDAILTDSRLFALVTQEQPFTSYALFPRADSVTTSTLNGSIAHQPMVRVSMNTTALDALQDGKLPPGSSFPDGSIIFKEIRSGGQTILFAILYKDRSNSLAGNGWLWAEYQPNGMVAFSVAAMGNGCISCHMRDQGVQHDLVRTFERQK